MLYRSDSLFLSLIVAAMSVTSYPYAQVTEITKKSDILSTPSQSGQVLGTLYPGTEIRKISMHASGTYVKAIVEFYVPLEALKEGRIAGRVGDSQMADDASIQLLDAQRSGEKVTVSVQIINQGDRTLDMSALLLFKIMDGTGLLGNLEFMESTHSVATIPPGQALNSQLIYSFPTEPRDVELIFRSKLHGDQVYFDLGF